MLAVRSDPLGSYDRYQGSFAEEIYSLACEEALRDGVVDAYENSVLDRLWRGLGLEENLAMELAQEVCEKLQGEPVRGCACFDPYRLYGEIMLLTRARGEIDYPVRILLDGVAESLTLDPERSLEIEVRLRPDEPALAWSSMAPDPNTLLARTEDTKHSEDSASEESGVSMAEVFGEPRRWTWSQPFAIASALHVRHWRFWLLLAFIGGIGSSIPFLGVLVWPFTTVLVVGAVQDALLLDEIEPGIGSCWNRWRGRILAGVWTALCELLLIAATVAGLGVFWFFSETLLIEQVGMSAGVALMIRLSMGTLAAALLGVLYLQLKLFAIQEAVLSLKSGFRALVGSRRVVRGNTLGIIGCLLAGAFLLLLGKALVAIPMVLLAVATRPSILAMGAHISDLIFLQLLIQLVAAVGLQLVANWYTVAWTCLYFRERARVDHDGERD